VHNGFGGKMSVNRNRAKFNKAHNGREYKYLFYRDKYGLYYEEYQKLDTGLYPAERRAFRTWKHNRKTQWKN
jgi:hypothetical protein